MTSDQLIPNGLGSTDWAGGKAPAGGLHTGTALITMQDGSQFTVSASRAEVLQRMDTHAIALTTPLWVSFDTPNSVVNVVLNVQNISSVV